MWVVMNNIFIVWRDKYKICLVLNMSRCLASSSFCLPFYSSVVLSVFILVKCMVCEVHRINT